MLSIITAFGCRFNCPYCIWRQEKRVYDPCFYDRVAWLSSFYRSVNETFSISGGGDPLEDFSLHERFWNRIWALCKSKEIQYDIHTSFHTASKNRFKNIRKLVVHIRNHNFRAVYADRVVMVADQKLTIDGMKLFERNHPNIELSYREVVGDEFKPSEDVLTFAQSIHERRNNGRFIRQDDYNQYLFPDGSIRTVFREEL
jgi:uncharacterized radical SAM superfamily protein